MARRAAIVVPVYNAAATVGKTVAACLAQDYPTDCLEIVFVDDASIDGTGKTLMAFPITVLSRPTGGPASARNTGWRATRAEIICFTNADCLPEPGWVRKLVALFDDRQVGGAGGTSGLANSNSWLARCLHEEMLERHRRMPVQTNFLGAFNVAYRRDILEETGGFPEDYHMAEDAGLSYEVVRRGFQLRFDRNVWVDHVHTERLTSYLADQLQYGYWWVRLLRRFPTMLPGDSYHTWHDILQPPLALLLPLLGWGGVGYAALRPWLVVAAALYVGLQLPMTMVIAERKNLGDALRLLPVTLLRGFVRGLGMGLGIIGQLLEPRGRK